MRCRLGKGNWICSESFEILKAEQNEPLIIGGIASDGIIDKQFEVIEPNAIRDDLPRFMENIFYRNLNLTHSNIQIGIILDSFKKNGEQYKTEVQDDDKFYVVASIRNDIDRARAAREEILRGSLSSYSLGGQPLTWDFERRDGHRVRVIKSLEIHEITVCVSPQNPDASFSVLQKDQKLTLARNIFEIPEGRKLYRIENRIYF